MLSVMKRCSRNDVTRARQEEEMKLDREMQAGRRLSGSVRLGPGTIVRFEGKLAP
jgi:hypothetical protein